MSKNTTLHVCKFLKRESFKHCSGMPFILEMNTLDMRLVIS